MNNKIPENLLFPSSNLSITLENGVFYNRTPDSVVIRGSRTGFLTLSNALLYLVNDLEDTIDCCEIPTVKCNCNFLIRINEDILPRSGLLVIQDGFRIEWNISEENLSLVATDIHSLGHLNSELHLEAADKLGRTSLYCVVDNI